MYKKPTSPKRSASSQPERNGTKPKKTERIKTEPKTQRVYKSQNIVPTNNILAKPVVKRNDTPKKRSHPEYGTSKLEETFAKEFLDKLGVRYEYQYKAESIKRYFDFYLPQVNVLIEVDGDYYHGYDLLYEEMSPMQKKNHRVDRHKDQWAAEHRIPLIRIWEHEIRKNPKEVMKMLEKRIGVYSEKYKKELEKKQRPNTNGKK
jgi:very-short-patch-repair endonuclease